jgi:hypothetical protein
MLLFLFYNNVETLARSHVEDGSKFSSEKRQT